MPTIPIRYNHLCLSAVTIPTSGPVPSISLLAIAYTDKVGQYSKSNAADAYHRPLARCLVGLNLFVAAAVFLVGLSVGEAISWVIGVLWSRHPRPRRSS